MTRTNERRDAEQAFIDETIRDRGTLCQHPACANPKHEDSPEWCAVHLCKNCGGGPAKERCHYCEQEICEDCIFWSHGDETSGEWVHQCRDCHREQRAAEEGYF